MEKFTPSELCADIKIYDYKQKVKYDEKSLVIFEKTGKMITAGKECEGMLYALPANSIGFSPIVLGRVSDYTCAEKMLKQMLCRYLGKASFTGYGEGLIFIHEKLNEVEMKAYFDLLYQAGAKNVVYADESVKGIPEGTLWEDVLLSLKKSKSLNKKGLKRNLLKKLPLNSCSRHLSRNLSPLMSILTVLYSDYTRKSSLSSLLNVNLLHRNLLQLPEMGLR